MKLSNNEIGTIEVTLANRASYIKSELNSISKKVGMSVDKFATYEVEDSQDVDDLLKEHSDIVAILGKLSTF